MALDSFKCCVDDTFDAHFISLAAVKRVANPKTSALASNHGSHAPCGNDSWFVD